MSMAEPNVAAAPVLSLQGIDKAFGPKPVLRGLDLDVYGGEILTILGMSGCGKSVLFKLIIGLMSVDRGEIVFDGAHVEQMVPAELARVRRRIGLVFQGAALFDSLSVGDNVAYGLREHYARSMSADAIRARVAWALAAVGLPGSEALRPAELSGGMRKRVGVARTIALQPEVLLYDEPTTGLDPINSRRMGQLIAQLRAQLGVTSVIVTHDLALAFGISDRLAFLHEGRIVALGTVAAVRASPHPIVREFLAAHTREDRPVAVTA
jgi:phospholipid/cholesterol/gamma-HCH transport system ATP-binding protein